MDAQLSGQRPGMPPQTWCRVSVQPCLPLLGLLAAILFLTGCAHEIVSPDQLIVQQRLALAAGHSVGQTFVAQHSGLSAVEVYLDPGSDCPGERLHLQLREQPQTNAVALAEATVDLSQVASPGYYRFHFQPRGDSYARYYYASLALERAGCSDLAVGLAPGDTYVNGSAYADDMPVDGQLTFRLLYHWRYLPADVLRFLVSVLCLLLVALFLFALPGLALLAWWRPQTSLAWPARLALATGLGLALYPLLLLWTHMLGLQLGWLYAWLPPLLALAILAYRYRNMHAANVWAGICAWRRSADFLSDVVLIIVVALAFTVRFLVIRPLEAPMWGDSVQHTVIGQLLVDNGGLFSSWEPYAPYQSLTVHFGFPVVIALLRWLSGFQTLPAALLAGQVINGLAVLALYPLALRLAQGSRWAGVAAVLAAGLLSPMPAEYVNWGRYAQLTGQAVLPVALWFLLEALEAKAGRRWAIALAAISLAGMALCYYRMPQYYASYVVAWLATVAIARCRLRAWAWAGLGGRLAAIALVSVLLLLPWARQVAGGELAMAVEAGLSWVSSWARVVAEYQIWRDVGDYLPPLLIIADLGALLWAAARRQWQVLAVGLWVGVLASLVAGGLISLPGANMIDNFAVLIMLYLPAGLLFGWLVAQWEHLTSNRAKGTARWDLAVLIITAGLWGARVQATVVEPYRIMVTRADMRAMTWIAANTAPEARFLVEGFRTYEGTSAVGADAGWWLPLLARRQNTMPPQYALLSEMPNQPGYTQQVVALVQLLEETSPASPEGIARLCDWGISHVYIGQGQGKTGSSATQLFAPEELLGSSAFSLLYHQDRVYVFALAPGVCAER